MEARDIADLFVVATARVEFYWNFYVVTVVAIFGWLISRKEPLTRQLKLVLTIGYAAFVTMNIAGLWGTYEFVQALRDDLVGIDGLENVTASLTVLQNAPYGVQKMLMLVVHAIMAAVVLTAIWRARPGAPESSAK